MEKNEFTISLYKDLELEEALSHKVHSRIFEILGYLDLVEKDHLMPEDQVSIMRIEDLCKKLLDEIHTIIDYYRSSAES